MSKVTPNFDFFPKKPELKENDFGLYSFAVMLRRLWQGMVRVVNGNLGFGDGTNPDNINGVWATVADTGLANTDFTITHNLNRIPVGYLTMTANVATDIYTGSVAATKTQITLRSSAAHAAMVFFII